MQAAARDGCDDGDLTSPLSQDSVLAAAAPAAAIATHAAAPEQPRGRKRQCTNTWFARAFLTLVPAMFTGECICMQTCQKLLALCYYATLPISMLACK
jgi:hypothetical protein